MATPFVSIILVNYNGKHFLDDCLASLEQQTYPRDCWEVVLVDNGSADGSVAYLRERYPWVKVIAAGRNLGFAAGNNEGFKHARGELLALLNNDTVVDHRWLEALVAAIQEDSRIGGVTSKILFKNEPSRINSAGLNLCRDGAGRDRGFRQIDRGQFDVATEVFGACGASVLLRRELIDDVGGFDERFFMYYEDLDLAWRARLRGWQFRYTPKSIVYHVVSGTSGDWSPFFTYHIERNRVFVNVKNGPLRLALWSLLVFSGRAAWKWLKVLTLRERTRRSWQQAWAYCRAAMSLTTGIPGMLGKRLKVRLLDRRVPDRTFAHLIAPRR